MVTRVEVEVHEEVIRELLLSRETKTMLSGIGDEVARMAQALAPKKTGRGARSIHSDMEIVGDSWEAHVSWSWPNAFYMYWHELGSRQLPPRPFLVPALMAAQ
jgi:hypothetical protein